jgi:hypothetical protein
MSPITRDWPLPDAGSVEERLTTPSWEVSRTPPSLNDLKTLFSGLFKGNGIYGVGKVWTFYADGSMVTGGVDEFGVNYEYGLFSQPTDRRWRVDGDILTMYDVEYESPFRIIQCTESDVEYESPFRIIQCTESDLELEQLDESAVEGTRRTVVFSARSRVSRFGLGPSRLFAWAILPGLFACVVISHVGSRRLVRNRWIVFIACWLGTVLIGGLIGSLVFYYSPGPLFSGSIEAALLGIKVGGFLCVIPGLINGVVAMRRPPLNAPISLYKKYNPSED